MANVRAIERASGQTAYEVRWRDGGKFRQRTFTVKRTAERFAESVEDNVAEGKSTAPLINKLSSAAAALSSPDATRSKRRFRSSMIVPSRMTR